MSRIVILGDSHTQYFRRELTLAREYHWDDFFAGVECHVFQSASVKGFGKRTSTLGLAEKVAESIGAGDIAVLNFGQVDMELGVYFRRFIKGEKESPKSFMDDSMAAYQALLDLVRSKADHFIVKGINLPVLVDQQKAIRYTHRIITENLHEKADIDKAARALMKDLPGIFERIALARTFNARLRELSIANGGGYFDINTEISYPNGLIREEFIPASFDHHLADTIKTRLIHLEAVKRAIGLLT